MLRASTHRLRATSLRPLRSDPQFCRSLPGKHRGVIDFKSSSLRSFRGTAAKHAAGPARSSTGATEVSEIAIIGDLSKYLWPAGEWGLRSRVVTAVGCLVASKLLTLQVSGYAPPQMQCTQRCGVVFAFVANLDTYVVHRTVYIHAGFLNVVAMSYPNVG